MHYSLLYISRVVNADNAEELAAIREQSIERNQACGLTGLLLWSHDYFCQILQGAKPAVEETMSRIARDTRHIDPIVLLRTDLAEALFPGWSMATSHIEDTAMASQIARAYHDRLADLSVVDGIIGLMQQFQQSSRYKTPIVYSRTGVDQQLATLAASKFSDKPIEQVLQLGCSIFNGCALVLLLKTTGGQEHYLRSSAGINTSEARSLVPLLTAGQSGKQSRINRQSFNVELPVSAVYHTAEGCEIKSQVTPVTTQASVRQTASAGRSTVIGSLWVLSESAATEAQERIDRVEFFRLADCLESLLEQKLQLHANELLRQMSRRQQLSLAAGNRRQEMVMNVASSAIVALDRDCRVLIINDAARKLFGGMNEPVPFHWPASIEFLSPWSLEPLPGPSCPIYLTATNSAANNAAPAVNKPVVNKPVVNKSRKYVSDTYTNEVSVGDAFVNSALATNAIGVADSSTLAGDANVNIVALQINESEPLRYLKVASSMVNEPESAISGVVVFDDVTELQHNRERIRRGDRLEALGHLTGGIAHDFNNLLSTIQSSVELATLEHNDKARQSFLEVALDSVQRGANLTDKLVAFAVARPVSARAHQLQDILQSVAELATASIEQDINFVVDEIPESLAVHCDGGQLENALLNVLINSRDAIIESGIGDTVAIAVKPTKAAEHASTEYADALEKHPAASQKIRITVTDNGPGMSGEVIRRATDPFFTTRGGGTGSGLGLSMVYRFVEQSGGELLIENLSDINPGSTGVRVTLLLDESLAQPVEVQATPAAKAQPPQRRATVLLVEDETSLAEMLQQSLSKFGLDTRVAHSADTALRELNRNNTIDLLLTDIVMPGSELDGYSLAAEAIRLNPSLKVVYLSGYPQQSGKNPAVTYGPLVKKPVSIKSLVTVIRAELHLSSTASQEKRVSPV